MKRILQAMDGVATKPVAGANDMSKFLSIIDKNDVSILNEGANPHKVSLPVQMAMQHYQQPQIQTPTKPVGRTSTFGKYFHKVEAELDEAVAEEQAHKRQLINQYASVIAERVLMKESLDEACWKDYKQVGMKKKGRKMVPNCVPKESIVDEMDKSQKGSPGWNITDDEPGGKEHYVKAVKSKDLTKAASKVLDKEMSKTHKKKVKEHEIPGHSMGFTGGVGPGIQSAVAEAPIAMDPHEPNNPTIHSHQQANPMNLKGRIQQVRNQLRDLANMAESNDLATWERICQLSKGGMFMGLEQNMEQVRHGIAELAHARKTGKGVAPKARGAIDKNIGEAVTPTIKPAKPKAIKPKAKTSTCRAGQTQTGVQNKDGKVVPKCTVVKKGF